MLDTNVLGPMRMVQTFLPLLIAAKGRIVNIGSIAPVVTLPFSSAYNASKAALHAYGDTVRVELAPFGVRVTTVVTGGVKSNIVKNAQQSLAKGSLFYPVKEAFEARVNLSQGDTSWEAREYADRVVREILGAGEGREVWMGGFAGVAWWVGNVLQKWVKEAWLARKFGLVGLKPV